MTNPDGKIESVVAFKDFVISPRGELIAAGCLYLSKDDYDTVDPTEAEAVAVAIQKGVEEMLSLKVEHFRGLLESFQAAEFLGSITGLRPHRKSGVRIESEILNGKLVFIHNNGYGGFGWTVALGAAGDVVDLAEETMRD